jgi:hypothetical protein
MVTLYCYAMHATFIQWDSGVAAWYRFSTYFMQSAWDRISPCIMQIAWDCFSPCECRMFEIVSHLCGIAFRKCWTFNLWFIDTQSVWDCFSPCECRMFDNVSHLCGIAFRKCWTFNLWFIDTQIVWDCFSPCVCIMFDIVSHLCAIAFRKCWTFNLRFIDTVHSCIYQTNWYDSGFKVCVILFVYEMSHTWGRVNAWPAVGCCEMLHTWGRVNAWPSVWCWHAANKTIPFAKLLMVQSFSRL